MLQLQSEIQLLCQQLLEQQSQDNLGDTDGVSEWKERKSLFDSDATTLATAIGRLLQIRNKWKHKQTLAKELVASILDEQIFAGILLPLLLHKAEPIIHMNNPLEDPMVVAKTMDIKGASLNLKVMENLWMMDSCDDDHDNNRPLRAQLT